MIARSNLEAGVLTIEDVDVVAIEAFELAHDFFRCWHVPLLYLLRGRLIVRVVQCRLDRDKAA